MTRMDQPRFGEFGEAAFDPAMAPTRLSAMAVASLVLGIVCVACLVGCLIPGVGAVPVLLSIGALIGIRRAGGRVYGRGLAFGGLILGILALVASSGLWLGAAAVLNTMSRTYASVFDPDPAKVRTVLTSDLAGSLTDEEIAEFQASLEAAHGQFVSMPKGLGDVILASRTASGSEHLGSIPSEGFGRLVPMPVEMSGGTFIVLFAIDPAEQLGVGAPAIADVGFFAGSTPEITWLVGPDGGTGDGSGEGMGDPADGDASPDTPSTDDGAEQPAPDPGE